MARKTSTTPPVKPLIDPEHEKRLPKEVLEAHGHLIKNLSGHNLDAYIHVVGGILARLHNTMNVAEAAILRGGSNPRNRQHWIDKRNAVKFKIECYGQGAWEVQGWDDLTKQLGLREAYIKVLLSKGQGSFTKLIHNQDTGANDVYTITRL